MRILEDCVLRERYDVIVVGAGLGGMTAASLLAKRGLSVLMIDQQTKPGGSCTSFKREDIVFDVGTAMIYGFGDKGFKPFRFLINELEEPIEIIAHSTLARMTFEGQEIIFWPDLNRFLDELGQLYPAEKDALRAFYTDLYKIYDNIVIKNEVVVPPSEFSARQGLRRVLSDPLSIVKMQRLLSISVKDLLDRYFHTPEIIHFFDKLCSAYAYTTAAETPAVLAATMFLDNHIGGVYYPAGGAQMLPNTIEKAFERDGGHALYRHRVDEILIRAGRAYGVRLSNGVEILADRVIANTTVWNLYGKLVRPEHIPPERLAWAQSLIPTFPSMTLYIVVDRAALPEGVFPWEIFIENRAVIDHSDLTLYINALVDHTLCPPGKLAVLAIAPNMCDWPSPEDAEYRSKAYRDLKKQEAERMIAQIDQHYPGFSQHIETLIVGTPTTLERYMLKNGGAVGGPKNAIGQHMLKRLHARSDSSKSPTPARKFRRMLPSRRRTRISSPRNARGANTRRASPDALPGPTSPASCGGWRRATTAARRGCCARAIRSPKCAATSARRMTCARNVATASPSVARPCASRNSNGGCARRPAAPAGRVPTLSRTRSASPCSAAARQA